jgi:serine/threonine-protein kinase
MNAPIDGATLADVQGALAGTWSLERTLGSGGMGTVFLARDVSLDRPVAIKVLHPALAARADERARFLREARTGARLSHPNVVPIYAVDEVGGFVFLVMGLVDGESLGTRLLREGTIPPVEAERFLHEIGWGLAYAHAMGVVHRDVTLDNILIERASGRALLADFGIAAEIDGADRGALVGTPAYLAPELIHGEAATAASDIYALGISAWTMLSGRFPFGGADTATVLLQHLAEPLPSLASAAPGASPRLVRAVEACLAKHPNDRPQSVERFLALLQRPGSESTLAAPLQRWVIRSARIRPAWTFAAAVVGILSTSAFADSMVALDPLSALGALLGSFLLVGIPTLLLQASFELREVRLVMRAGYGVEDLRLARRAHAALPAPSEPSLLGRIVHDLTWLSAGAILLLIQVIRYAPMLVSAWETYVPFVMAVVDVARWCWIVLWTGIGASFVVRQTSNRTKGRIGIVDRFWESRFGAMALRLAGYRLGPVTPTETTVHRPTELVLDLAIEELWEALPASARTSLAELPALAGALRARIAEMRLLRETLLKSESGPPAEAATLQERLRTREGLAITALERLRLQLARLTLDIAPEGEFTRQLVAAQALDVELLEELGGHAGLRRILGARTLGDLTPTEATP